MTRLRVASLNMSGAQDGGAWARFLTACAKWAARDGIDVYLGQEHNLNPLRLRELKRMAEHKGFALVIGFAEAAPDGVHRGGVLVLMRRQV